VPDVIEPAKTSRASCRGCGRNIARGDLRFGESLPNAYGEGESMFWFHLTCAACMRPEKLEAALEHGPDGIPDRDQLQRTANEGIAHARLTRLVRAERAPSGSAHCRHCRELIGKGAWRIALQVFEDGRMQPIGTIHAECAADYFGTADILNRIRQLTEGLSHADLAEIAERVQAR
jgi:hypothetical protein